MHIRVTIIYRKSGFIYIRFLYQVIKYAYINSSCFKLHIRWIAIYFHIYLYRIEINVSKYMSHLNERCAILNLCDARIYIFNTFTCNIHLEGELRRLRTSVIQSNSSTLCYSYTKDSWSYRRHTMFFDGESSFFKYQEHSVPSMRKRFSSPKILLLLLCVNINKKIIIWF